MAPFIPPRPSPKEVFPSFGTANAPVISPEKSLHNTVREMLGSVRNQESSKDLVQKSYADMYEKASSLSLAQLRYCFYDDEGTFIYDQSMSVSRWLEIDPSTKRFLDFLEQEAPKHPAGTIPTKEYSGHIQEVAKRVLRRVYGKQILASREKGIRPSAEDSRFLVHDFAENALDSSLANLYFKMHGIRDQGNFAERTGSDEETIRELLVDPETGRHKVAIAEDVVATSKAESRGQDRKRLTTEIVINALGIVGGALIFGSNPLLLAASLVGSKALSKITSMATEKIMMMKAKGKDKKTEISLSQEAYKDVVKGILDQHSDLLESIKKDAQDLAENPKPGLSVEQQLYEGKRDHLNLILTGLQKKADANLKEGTNTRKFLDIEKKAKRWSALAGIVGGIVGGSLTHFFVNPHIETGLLNSGFRVDADMDGDGIRHGIQMMTDSDGVTAPRWLLNVYDFDKGLSALVSDDNLFKSLFTNAYHDGNTFADLAKVYAHADLHPAAVNFFSQTHLLSEFKNGAIQALAFINIAQGIDSLIFRDTGKVSKDFERTARALVSASTLYQATQRTGESAVDKQIADARKSGERAGLEAKLRSELKDGDFWEYEYVDPNYSFIREKRVIQVVKNSNGITEYRETHGPLSAWQGLGSTGLDIHSTTGNNQFFGSPRNDVEDPRYNFATMATAYGDGRLQKIGSGRDSLVAHYGIQPNPLNPSEIIIPEVASKYLKVSTENPQVVTNLEANLISEMNSAAYGARKQYVLVIEDPTNLQKMTRALEACRLQTIYYGMPVVCHLAFAFPNNAVWENPDSLTAFALSVEANLKGIGIDPTNSLLNRNYQYLKRTEMSDISATDLVSAVVDEKVTYNMATVISV